MLSGFAIKGKRHMYNASRFAGQESGLLEKLSENILDHYSLPKPSGVIRQGYSWVMTIKKAKEIHSFRWPL